MTMSRKHVVQPGPMAAVRVEDFGVPMRRLEFVLEQGRSLVDAVAEPLMAAGITTAGLALKDFRLGPMKYVMPAVSPDKDHVAFYSETFVPERTLTIEAANITFGSKDGKPFVHCHAFWREESGELRGGHILPFDTFLAAPARAVAVGCAGITMVAEFDAETNFTLFHPVGAAAPATAAEGRGIVARIRPNEDLIETIEAMCLRHSIRDGVVQSCIGSLIGFEFEDGQTMDASPTEIMVLEGRVANGRAELKLALIDTKGRIYQGRPIRGRNPILICCEVFIRAA